jgi:hypothetical protein
MGRRELLLLALHPLLLPLPLLLLQQYQLPQQLEPPWTAAAAAAF